MEQEREKILAEERAIWEERLRRIEAKVDGKAMTNDSPKVSTVDKQGGSGQGSCSNLLEKGAKCAENLINSNVKKSLDLEHLTDNVKDVIHINGLNLGATEKDGENVPMVVDLDIQKGECQAQQIGKEYELASGSIDNVVAVATIIEGNGECNSQLIHGIPLGEGNIRVSIVRSIVDEALLPFPIKDEILTVRDAIGTYVAWPKDLIIFPTEKMAAKSQGMKKPRKRAEGNDDDEEEDLDMQSLPPNVPASLKMVCMWVKETLTNGKTIICTFDEKIFGKVSKTFVSKKDISNFATMKEVSGSCISIYISYLHGVLKKSKMVEMVGFVCPTDIGVIGCGNPIERSRAITNRMRNAKRGQIFFLPYNCGAHWMLTVINPHEDIVYFMDPLKRRLATGEWKDIVNNGIKIHNAEVKRQGRKPTAWKNCAGIPVQQSSTDCGYFIMRYMKDIVEDKNLEFFSKWEKKGKAAYTQQHIDEVRNEWAKFVVTTYM